MTDIDNIPINFGKYQKRRLTPRQIANEDPKYIIWMYETVKPKACSRDLYMSCVEQSYEQDYDDFEPLDFGAG
jgi:hypothetical protein